jgi:hypothetical protein
MYHATKRIYLNRADQVCEENDPDAATLLVGVGGTLSDAQARKYGLVQDDASAPEAPAESKAVAEPPHTKAMRAPKGAKSEADR